MTLAVARAGEDRALKSDVVSARDLFQLFPVHLTGAHSIEHPSIVFARHKFLLFGRVLLQTWANAGRMVIFRVCHHEDLHSLCVRTLCVSRLWFLR